MQGRMGAGTLVKKIVEAAGIRQKEDCKCKERQKRLDRAVEFVGRGKGETRNA